MSKIILGSSFEIKMLDLKSPMLFTKFQRQSVLSSREVYVYHIRACRPSFSMMRNHLNASSDLKSGENWLSGFTEDV